MQGACQEDSGIVQFGSRLGGLVQGLGFRV